MQRIFPAYTGTNGHELWQYQPQLKIQHAYPLIEGATSTLTCPPTKSTKPFRNSALSGTDMLLLFANPKGRDTAFSNMLCQEDLHSEITISLMCEWCTLEILFDCPWHTENSECHWHQQLPMTGCMQDSEAQTGWGQTRGVQIPSKIVCLCCFLDSQFKWLKFQGSQSYKNWALSILHNLRNIASTPVLFGQMQ